MSAPGPLDRELQAQLARRVTRLRRARTEKHSLLAQTVYLGTLGLVFVLPVLAGAYAGLWLDSGLTGYSQSWTLSLIFLGLCLGGANVYLLMKE